MSWPEPSPSDLNRKAMPRTPRKRQMIYVAAILGAVVVYIAALELFGFA